MFCRQFSADNFAEIAQPDDLGQTAFMRALQQRQNRSGL